MGRWTQYDEDSYRLPEGMVRIGYDADTQEYTFRDMDGSHWTGAPGCEYGRMNRTSAANTDYMYGLEPNPSGPRPGGSAWKLEQLAAKQQSTEKDIKPSSQVLTPFLHSVYLVVVSVYRHIKTGLAADGVLIEPKDYKEVKCRNHHHTTRRHILGHCTEPRYKLRRTQSLKSWRRSQRFEN